MFYTHKTECFVMYTELRTHVMAVHTDCVFLVSWFCVFLVLVSTDTYIVETGEENKIFVGPIHEKNLNQNISLTPKPHINLTSCSLPGT